MDSMDASVLRVLLVEDCTADAELILRALREYPDPFEHARVASEDALRQALAEFRPDVVLSDFSMPGFSGKQALAIVREHDPALPFLFVSGTIGEEAAIEALRRGAVDYVLKDNLRRLASAVERALRAADEQQQRREMERALRESEERFRSIVEHSQDWIWEMTLDRRHTYSNHAVERILGYPSSELLGRDALEHLHPAERERVDALLADAAGRQAGWTGLRLRWCARDGRVRTLESSGTPLLDQEGVHIGYRGIDHDITELLEQQERIRHLARLHAVLGGVGNSLLRIRERARLLDEVCRVAVTEGGFDAAAVGLPVDGGTQRIANSHGDRGVLECLRHLDELGEELQMQRPGFRVLQRGAPLYLSDLEGGDAGELARAVREPLLAAGVRALAVLPLGDPRWGVMALYSREPQAFNPEERELLERLRLEIDFGVDSIAKSERLEFLAYRNPVSELFNRVAFQQRLDSMLPEEVCIALVDVERFAAINESRGRAFGDLLLHQVGARLRALVGASTLVAHPEADNFAFAYRASGTVDTELQRLEELLDEFEKEPFEVDGQEIRLGFRAGLAVAPDHGLDAETLENNAAVALAEAKKRGLRLFGFNEELRGRAARRHALEHELRVAIETGQFELYYQPKFRAADQRLVGAEALLRWRHPERGLVSPAEFIPLLEESSLIEPVGRWVMQEALRAGLAWRVRRPGLRVAVNVSARELRHARFLEQVRALLQPHAGDQVLDIEVTESMLMEEIESSIHLLDSLRDLGCRVAIDDFGTGYSSLNYLARLPVDTIKIDQSFIGVLTQSPQTLALVTNMIGLAHSLALDVVAEGVEEEGQAQLLRLLRCDILQGYLLGRPMPAAEFESRLLGDDPAAADCA
jgi:PAS domain S-box-containing protein/diguanylate cyclase (GGDEF)-like protein